MFLFDNKKVNLNRYVYSYLYDIYIYYIIYKHIYIYINQRIFSDLQIKAELSVLYRFMPWGVVVFTLFSVSDGECKGHHQRPGMITAFQEFWEVRES